MSERASERGMWSVWACSAHSNFIFFLGFLDAPSQPSLLGMIVVERRIVLICLVARL